MRHVKIAVGLIGAVCAFGVFASAALATSMFEATAGTKTKSPATLQTVKRVGSSKAAYPQSFTLQAEYINKSDEKVKAENYSVHCATVKATGPAPTTPSSTIRLKVTYQDCWYHVPENPGTGSPYKASVVQSKEHLTEWEYNTDGELKLLTSIEVRLPKAGCLLTIDSDSFSAVIPPEMPEYHPWSFENQIFKPTPESKAFEKEFPSGQERVEVVDKVHPHAEAHEKGETGPFEDEGGLEWAVEPTKENSKVCAVLEEGGHAEYERGKFEGEMKLELPGGQFKVS